MKCPYCSNEKSKVLDKRDKGEEGLIRRRRECTKCQRRFSTQETLESVDIIVQKKDGAYQPYNPDKLRKSIKKSLDSTPELSDKNVDVFNNVEAKLLLTERNTVNSSEIGEIVLNELLTISPIAYMRFATVFRRFTRLEDIEAEIKRISPK